MRERLELETSPEVGSAPSRVPPGRAPRGRSGRRWLGATVLLVGWCAIGTRALAQESVRLRVSGDVPHPMVLSDSDLRAMPRSTVRASEHGKEPVTYDGVSLTAVLERVGVTFGSQLRGPRLATYVVIDAADGYRVTFAIAELDSAFTNKQVLVVDRKDGAPLAADEGPLRIVVPDEKRPARWVRQVVGVRVLMAPSPE